MKNKSFVPLMANMNKIIVTLTVSSIVLLLSFYYYAGVRETPTETFAILVDTKAKLRLFLDLLSNAPLTTSHLYCDLEGIRLSRHGSISIVTIYFPPLDKVYLIDVHALREFAFSTPTKEGVSLKSIFESPKIVKVFFDVRNDSDALYSLYGVAMAGVKDIQLMELGSRYGGLENRKYVAGLAKCIARNSQLSPEERSRCSEIKERGVKMFAPEKGGSYEVFNRRPMAKEILEYCALDVTVLPKLYEVYNRILSQGHKSDWRKRVEHETLERVRLSQSEEYQPEGPHKVLGPWQ